MFRHFQPFRLEFLGRIDSADYFVIKLISRLYLTHHLWPPFPGYVTIGTDRTHASRIFVVDTRFVFFVDRGHFMAGGAKCHTVGFFDDRMKATPENNAEQGADDEHKQCRFIYSLTHVCNACKKAPYVGKGPGQLHNPGNPLPDNQQYAVLVSQAIP
jgi:hypothetical protein